jgi:hypothetical protein|tara:strand:+ start:393 stop:548 length:156 start_codon:yes stop_codon:yes gene_type:complete
MVPFSLSLGTKKRRLQRERVSNNNTASLFGGKKEKREGLERYNSGDFEAEK